MEGRRTTVPKERAVNAPQSNAETDVRGRSAEPIGLVLSGGGARGAYEAA